MYISYTDLLAMRTIANLMSPEVATISQGEPITIEIVVEGDNKRVLVRVVRK